MANTLVDLDSVLAWRLVSQHLAGPRRGAAVDVVRGLMCVQAQDAPLARWSLSLRLGDKTDGEICEEIDTGAVIRTHVLRPTWHYVAAEDLRWLLELTSPKVISSMASELRRHGLDDDATVADEHARLVESLRGGRFHTRRQLVDEDRRGDRLRLILLLAELTGLVCSGPLVDRTHSYALADERLPDTRPKDRDAAVREVVERFFTGHGPATVAHLARWTTLTQREVRAALDDLGEVLTSTDVDGIEFWHDQRFPTEVAQDGTWLLPVFDEAFLPFPQTVFPRVSQHPWGADGHAFAEAGGGVVVSGLRDIGWWKRKDSPRTTVVTLGLAAGVGVRRRRAVEEQAARLAAFGGREVAVEFVR